MQVLIDAGCRIDNRDNIGQTEMFYAARDGRLEAVRFLIQNGANVNS